MTTCRRRICGTETDDEAFCSERCERLYSPAPRPETPSEREAQAHREAEIRQRTIQGRGCR